MEIQIPLVLFTSFLAWSIGIFGTQCVLALKKLGGDMQLASLIVSFAMLVIGGVSVVFHLTHPFNIFNGFGHITSGITQELIAIVVLVVVMVLFFLMLRRSSDNTVPVWLAIVGLIACLLLAISMGHSYMMSARPSWNSIFQLLSLVGAACVMGPATVAVIAAVKKVELPGIGMLVAAGAIVNAVLTAAYLIAMQLSSGTFQSYAYYFDPTHPNYPLVSGDDISLFAGDCLTATVVVIVCAVVAVVAAFVGKSQKTKWATWGSVVAIAGFICAIALRAAMYILGETLFMLY